MASSDYQTQVYTMFVGYFGRPPAPAGLEYYSQVMDTSGGNWKILVNDFWNSAESQSIYGNENVATEVKVNQIFNNLFGRDAAPAGLTYWTLQVNLGNVSLPELVYAIANNGVSAADQKVLDAKIATAETWVTELDTTEEVLAFQATDGSGHQAARDLLNTVNAENPVAVDQAGVDKAIADMMHPSTPGETFSLTAGFDNIQGTAGDDTIVATDATLQPSDQIDGKAGNDQIKIFMNDDGKKDTGPSVAPNMKNVEKMFVQVLDADGGTIDLTNTTGVKQIWSNNSAGNLTVKNIQNNAALGITSPTGTNTNFIAQFAAAAVTGDLSVTLDNANLGVLRADDGKTTGFATVDIDVQAGESQLGELRSGSELKTYDEKNKQWVYHTNGDVATLNIKGDGKLTIVGPLDATVKTIDASANKGGVDLNITDSTQDVNFKGGGGDDRIYFGVTFDAKDVVDGGAGHNILGIGGQGQIVDGLQISNISVLEVSNLNGALDASMLPTGIEEIQVTKSLSGKIDNFSSDTLFTTQVGGDVVINVIDADKPGHTSDILNVNLALPATGTVNLKANSVETVNLTNPIATTNATTVSLTDNALINLTVSSVQGSVTNLVDIPNTVQLVNAGSAQGNVTLKVQGGNNIKAALTGGAGDDILVGGDGADLLIGGAGNDVLQGDATAASQNTLTGGDGNDIFILTSGGTEKTMDIITDLNLDSDKIQLKAAGYEIEDLSKVTILNKGASVSMDGDTLDKAIEGVVNSGKLNGVTGAGLFKYNDHTYFIANNGGNDFNKAIVADVTGFSGTLDTSDLQWTKLTKVEAPTDAEKPVTISSTSGGSGGLNLKGSDKVVLPEMTLEGSQINLGLGQTTVKSSVDQGLKGAGSTIQLDGNPDAKIGGADNIEIDKSFFNASTQHLGIDIVGFTVGYGSDADTIQLDGIKNSNELVAKIKSIDVYHSDDQFEHSFTNKDFLDFEITLKGSGNKLNLYDLIAYDHLDPAAKQIIGACSADGSTYEPLVSVTDSQSISKLIGIIADSNIEYNG